MRIVSLCPSLTELAFDLGRGDDVVGITRYCVHPAAGVATVEKVGGPKNPKIDRIVELAPDVVLMNEEENRLEDAEELTRAGLRCHTSLPRTVDDVAAMVRSIGAELGRTEEAERIARDVEERSRRVRRDARGRPQVRWAYLIWRKPWMAVNSDTLIGSLLTQAGGHNVFGDHRERYPAISATDLVAARPDVVLLSTEPFPFETEHVEELAGETGFSRDRFRIVDGELLSWHGSRTPAGIDYAEEVIRRSARHPPQRPRCTMSERIAILLCAGYGTRMGELTAEVPKPLLPVAGKPVLDYLVEQLVGLSGLDAVHVASNARYVRSFEEWAEGWRRRSPAGLPIKVHDDGTRDAGERLGAVGDLAFVLERVGAVDGALVASGDNILRFSLEPLWRAAAGGDASLVLALHEPDPARLRRTGVLEIGEDQRVLGLHEKPDEPPSQWACPSIYWLSAAALERTRPYLDANHPRDETGRFVAWLAQRQTVLAVPVAGERLHVGSPEAYRRADRILRAEPVIKPGGARFNG